MNIYIVERWNGLDFDIEKILTDFEVTKEHVKRNTKDVSDDYRVTSWTLADGEYTLVKKYENDFKDGSLLET